MSNNSKYQLFFLPPSDYYDVLYVNRRCIGKFICHSLNLALRPGGGFEGVVNEAKCSCFPKAGETCNFTAHLGAFCTTAIIAPL